VMSQAFHHSAGSAP